MRPHCDCCKRPYGFWEEDGKARCNVCSPAWREILEARMQRRSRGRVTNVPLFVKTEYGLRPVLF